MDEQHSGDNSRDNNMNDQNTEELIRDLRGVYGLALIGRPSAEQLEIELADMLNNLIREDFQALLRLLYRIDIDEAKLRYLLQQYKGTDAGRIIARLIIDRQWEKIESRRRYKAYGSGRAGEQDEEGAEKW